MLRTERLLLRAPKVGDSIDLFTVFGDPFVMRYWSTVADPNLAATRARIERMVTGSRDPITYFTLDYAGRAIGMAGNYRDDEVGFILGRAFHRRGFGKEAMEAIVPYLWDVTDLRNLTADIDPRNAGSAALLTSLGFRETHRARNTYQIDGEWSDSQYFRLDRPKT